MHGTQFDPILKEALVNSVLSEYADLISDAQKKDIRFSRRYRDRKKHMLRDPMWFLRRKNSSQYLKVIRALAVAALILMMSLAAGAVLIPYKRNFKIERYPAYIEVQILQDGDCCLDLDYGDFYPEYLPAGYYENVDRRSKVFKFINYQFLGPDGTEILYRVQGLAGGSVMCFDNEHGLFEEIKINHRAAIIKRSSEEGWPNEVLWFSKDGTIMFNLSSTLKSEELERIAKSIH